MPTVTVACKIPNGIIIEHAGKKATLNGSNVAISAPHYVAMPHLTPGGYGITPNVDEALWNGWSVEYKDSFFLKDGLIFAASKSSDVTAQASEKKAIKSGLEGIDPEKPGAGIKKYDPLAKE